RAVRGKTVGLWAPGSRAIRAFPDPADSGEINFLVGASGGINRDVVDAAGNASRTRGEGRTKRRRADLRPLRADEAGATWTTAAEPCEQRFGKGFHAGNVANPLFPAMI